MPLSPSSDTQHRALLMRLARAERALRRVWMGLPTVIRRAVFPGIVEAIDAGDVDLAMSMLRDRGVPQRIERMLLGAVSRVAGEVSAQVARDLTGLAIRDMRPIAYARRHAAERVRYITEDMRATIRTIITTGLLRGETGDELRDRLAEIIPLLPQQISRLAELAQRPDVDLREELARMRYARALTIARTETMSASEAARYEQARLDGARAKVWRTAIDAAVCDICDPVEGTQLSLDDTFPGVDVPHPPAHPNCRCIVQYVAP